MQTDAWHMDRCAWQGAVCWSLMWSWWLLWVPATNLDRRDGEDALSVAICLFAHCAFALTAPVSPSPPSSCNFSPGTAIHTAPSLRLLAPSPSP
jgi:hypothetical protein